MNMEGAEVKLKLSNKNHLIEFEQAFYKGQVLIPSLFILIAWQVNVLKLIPLCCHKLNSRH